MPQRPSWRRFPPILILILLVGSALGLCACWPLSDSAPPPATTPTTATPPPPATVTEGPPRPEPTTPRPPPGATGTPAPEQGEQQLTLIGGLDDPPTLDPALAADAQSLFVVRQLFSGLLRLDDDLRIVPDLAGALPVVSTDGLVYTFRLRADARWPDGQAVTAADVVYSLERATDPALAAPRDGSALPAALYLNDIAGVAEKLAGTAPTISGLSAPDAQTVRITLLAPRAPFLAKLTVGPAFVVDRRNVQAGGAEWARHPAGTGPFRLRDWQPGAQMVLVPNPVTLGGAPKLSQVTILLGAGAGGAVQQYEQGVVDVAPVTSDDLARLSDPANPLASELVRVPELSTTYLGFNATAPPFDDPNVREAFSLVIDRSKIARVLFKAQVRPAAGIVPPEMPGYVSAIAPTTLDVTRARQLLAQSRYGGSTNLPRITLYTTGTELGPLLQSVFQQQLGVAVELRQVEWTDYLAGLAHHQFPLYLLTWGADWPDPSSFLEGLFRSTSSENHLGYNDPQVDAALDSAAAERDPAARARQYAALEKTILATTPIVPLLHNESYMLVRPYVHGLRLTPLGILTLRDTYVSSRTGDGP